MLARLQLIKYIFIHDGSVHRIQKKGGPPRPPRYWLYMLMSTVEMTLQDGAAHNYGYVVTPFHSSRDVSSLNIHLPRPTTPSSLGTGMSSQSNLLNSSYHNYYFTISAERYEHSRSKRHHPRRVFSHTGYQIIRYTRDIILYTVRHFSTFALIVFLSFISNSGFSVHSRSLDTNQNWR